jgi:alpha-galactosidase
MAARLLPRRAAGFPQIREPAVRPAILGRADLLKVYVHLQKRKASMRHTRTLLGAIVAVGLPAAGVQAVEPTAVEAAAMATWIESHLGPGAATMPFSFTYGGHSSSELLPQWQAERSSEQIDSDRTRLKLAWTDPATGLRLRCVAIQYADFPTFEWTLYFKNTGERETPILKSIQALDANLMGGASEESVLHHAVGSPANGSDYGPLETPLGPGAAKRISAAGGRPTNSDLSYFNLARGDQGMIVVVGWPGQ